MSKDQVIEKLKSLWLILNEQVTANVAEKWWMVIVNNYTKKERKFHNLENVARLLIFLDEYEKQITSAKAVSLAIFFHYIEYDSRSMDNEEKSANVFKEFAKEIGLNENDSVLKAVNELILSTNAHVTDEHLSAENFGNSDKHYFLDFDFAYMGSDEDVYKKYIEMIREEYNFMDDKNYCDLRLKALRSLLKMPKLFGTELMHKRYEEKARKNIEAEIVDIEKIVNKSF